MILDALIRRLGQGLEHPTAPPAGATEEEQIGADDETPPAEPVPPPDLPRLARACRSKVRRLLNRMAEQLRLACENETPRRAMIQLAAVLGILRALRRVEQRQEWKRLGDDGRLLHVEAMFEFFQFAAAWVCVGDDAAAPAALRTVNGAPFDELSAALGLLVWLAWECEVDLPAAAQKDGRVGYEEDLWGWVQQLAYLAPLVAFDERARQIAKESIRQTARRGADADAWISGHFGFLRRVAEVSRSPDTAGQLSRAPRPGDLVVLPERFSPRVRICLAVEASATGVLVEVLDEFDEQGTKKFLSNRVGLVSRTWPGSGERVA
ncbi:MAG: hypothetical protein R3B13_38055 [Polyangiaceae bacterium]